MWYTTLNQIRKFNPCEDRWKVLLSALGKLKADNEPLSVIQILDICGFMDALWGLRAFSDHKKEIGFLACDYAEHVLFIFEAKYPDDGRPRAAIAAARGYIKGEISKNGCRSATYAAYAADAAAARAAAYASDDSTSAAARAAAYAVDDATSAANRAVAYAADDATRAVARAASFAADAATRALAYAADAAYAAADAAAYASAYASARAAADAATYDSAYASARAAYAAADAAADASAYASARAAADASAYASARAADTAERKWQEQKLREYAGLDVLPKEEYNEAGTSQPININHY